MSSTFTLVGSADPDEHFTLWELQMSFPEPTGGHAHVMDPDMLYSAKGIELEGYDYVTDRLITMVITWGMLAEYIEMLNKLAERYNKEG